MAEIQTAHRMVAIASPLEKSHGAREVFVDPFSGSVQDGKAAAAARITLIAGIAVELKRTCGIFRNAQAFLV
jgi:hypothetical protein